MRKTRVYVAGPYTKGDVAMNVGTMIQVCDEILAAGYMPYCPLLTHFWHFYSPKNYETWMEHDEAWLDTCDCIYRMEGLSSGADMEVNRMVDVLGRPKFSAIEALVAGMPTEVAD